MVSPIQVVAVEVRRTVLAVAVDQESSLFVIQFLLHHLFRQRQQLQVLRVPQQR